MTLQTIGLAAVGVFAAAVGPMLAAGSAHGQSRHATDGRVFELRIYHTYPGRLAALQANFREHNIEFLQKHGITSIGYWTPQDSPASENTLVFIVAHPSREAADRNWKAFRADPEWMAFAKASEAGGPIVERVESTFMAPADYSALR
jgi:hypothetical protein